LVRPYDRVSQRHKVPNGGTSPKVLQIFSSGAALTFSREGFDLLFGLTDSRVQFGVVLVIKLSGDGFVDARDHRVHPERGILVIGAETGNLSRAGDKTRSVNHIETTM